MVVSHRERIHCHQCHTPFLRMLTLSVCQGAGEDGKMTVYYLWSKQHVHKCVSVSKYVFRGSEAEVKINGHVKWTDRQSTTESVWKIDKAGRKADWVCKHCVCVRESMPGLAPGRVVVVWGPLRPSCRQRFTRREEGLTVSLTPDISHTHTHTTWVAPPAEDCHNMYMCMSVNIQ